MRLIDADKVIQGLRRTIDAHQNGDDDELLTNRIFEKFIEWLMRAPTVEAEPIRHGEWIETDEGDTLCSECGHITSETIAEYENDKNGTMMRFVYPYYCLYCGAKMDGKPKRN